MFLFYKCKLLQRENLAKNIKYTYCSLKSSIGGSNLMGLDGKLPSLTLKKKKYIYTYVWVLLFKHENKND